MKLAVVGRCRGNGCPAQLPRSCPAGWAGFGSPCPWPVAVPGARRSVIGCGLVGSSHDAILWSRACHTFPSPRLRPWARLPITVAAAWCRVTFSVGARQCWSPHALLLADPDTQTPSRPLPSQLLTAHHPCTKPNLRPVVANNGRQKPAYLACRCPAPRYSQRGPITTVSPTTDQQNRQLFSTRRCPALR